MIKVSPNARKDYIQHCPISTMKCDDFAEIDYKIIRAIELGKLMQNKNGIKIYLYYHLVLMVVDNEVKHIGKTEYYCFKVGEKIKQAHYKHYHKNLA